MNKDGSKVTFLIVDDDEVAVMGIKRAIRKLNLANPVEVAHNGEEALEILRDSHKIRKPYLVTLDLNMPRMGGLEFLEEMRSDADINDSIVFVMSTSDAPADITKAYEKNIAGYIIKDNAYETLKSALALLKDYTQIVQLPLQSVQPNSELRLA